MDELIAVSHRADRNSTLGTTLKFDMDPAAAQALSVSELKQRLTEMNVDHSDCLEKDDLVQRYIASGAS